MSFRDPMAWRSDLELAERADLASGLASALLGYWHNDPVDIVLESVAKVLAEWQELAATPDRIRPSDTVTVADFGNGGDQ